MGGLAERDSVRLGAARVQGRSRCTREALVARGSDGAKGAVASSLTCFRHQPERLLAAGVAGGGPPGATSPDFCIDEAGGYGGRHAPALYAGCDRRSPRLNVI